MNMKTVFFLGLIIGSMTTFGWNNLFETESIVASPEVSNNKTVDHQETPPETSVTAQTTEILKAKECDDKSGYENYSATMQTNTASHDSSSDTDVYDMQDATIMEVIELENQSVIDEAREIELEVENVALSTEGGMDQYDPTTGRKYDELVEEEEQLQASQLMDDGELTVEKEINELSLLTTEEGGLVNGEGTLEPGDPVE